MKLTDQQTRHIAALAKIHLEDDKVNRLTADLSSILTMAQTLEQVDCDTIEPLAHPLEEVRLPQRDDLVTEENQREVMQAIAPQVTAGLYLVPQVIE